MALCPCGSGAGFDECCGPIIRGKAPAPTAETLMRSRYTAFVRGDLDHIERTYAREQRQRFDRPGAGRAPDPIDWLGLEVFETSGGGADDDFGTVDFAARYRRDGEILVHRECSNFRREGGQWVYVDGDPGHIADDRPAGKVGRNQPCPCGSGRKFRKCCGA